MSRCKCIVVALLLLTGALRSAPATAQPGDPFAPIFQAIDQQQYDRARELLQPLVEGNNARAIYILAYMYQAGQGLPVDLQKANELYAKSAALKFDPAVNNLGVSYRDGRGLAQSYQQALELFTQAAALGNRQAALNAGVLYVNGQGVRRDYVEGYAWYLIADTDVARRNMAELEQKVLTAQDIDKAKARAQDIRRELDALAAEILNEGKPGGIAALVSTQSDGRVVVTAVKPGSKTAEMGLQPDDELIEVDGKPVKGLSQQQIATLLQGPAGSIINLRLKRGQQNVQLAFPREPIGN
jgi:C-terminal processing protease CtpA/Prc